MKRKALIVVIILLVLGLDAWQKHQSKGVATQGSTNEQRVSGSGSVHSAFKQRLSNVQIGGVGIVKKVLPDDLDGSRHQRFILDVGNKLSILVAHNIDLADKIHGLRRADSVEFMGEYEWTNKGGVIHWTHHDPRGKHPGGWLKHNGVIYE
ncbi:MAG: hypothetical protein ACI9J2_000459 [Saprospiraceae bacterium]|jgi:hypothetical protein